MAEELVGKIRVIKAILQDFKKRLSSFSSLDKSLHDSDTFLNLQISDFTEEFAKAKKLHADIIALGTDDNEDFLQYNSQKVFEALQNVYFNHSTTLHEYVKIISRSNRSDSFLDSTHAVRNNGSNHPQMFSFERNSGYLEGLVPEFDGTPSLWPEFMDAYITHVHSIEEFSDGYKLKILQSVLKSDASKVVKREFGFLRVSDYSLIWEKLVQRYNNKKSIVYSYLQELCFQPFNDKENSLCLKTIYDTTYDAVSGLKALGLPVDEWGDLLLFLTYSKLPLITKEKWDERHNKSDSLPKFSDFLEFLEQRFRTLEGLEATRKSSQKSYQPDLSLGNKKGVVKKFSTLQTTAVKVNSQLNSKIFCKLCNKGSHALRKCFSFKKLKVSERINIVKSLGYCINCLSYSHTISNCSSEIRCEHCKDMHNTLLCLKFSRNPRQANLTSATSSNYTQVQSQPATSNQTNQCDERILQTDLNTYSTRVSEPIECESTVFPTALVKVLTSGGNSIVLRAMIDKCSDASYITEQAVRRLKIDVKKTEVQTTGLGNIPTSSCIGVASFEIFSTVNQFSKQISAYVLSLISPNRPIRNFKINENIRSSIKLADPTYNRNSKIDLLLGGSIDASIHLNGSFKCREENMVFRETELGWIASGSIPQVNCFSTIVERKCNSNSEGLQLVLKSLDDTLRKFWEIEEVSDIRDLTMEEKLCESIYENTTRRLQSGRYLVRLPFNKSNCEFINMRDIAIKRFYFLEKRLSKNLSLKDQYSQCMQEYIDLQHMTQVDPNKYTNSYYIPHHCVIKESSSTTKLRVVFDASAKDVRLQCLNDNLLNGPRLQPDLLDLLIKFRTFKIAFTADVAKMYRQILVHPDDRMYQLILWRTQSSEEIRTYCLNTVTFGTKTAPYLAVKTLLQVAEDEKKNALQGYDCLTNGFYVDDCIYGSDSVEEALIIQSQVIQVLKSAGFHLRKWSSNTSEIIEAVPESDRETKSLFEFDGKTSIKTLGIQWSPSEDTFCYKFSFPEVNVFTKRNILSDIAKIFDPLGWISPCLITAKLLIQRMWAEKIDWDETISNEISEKWRILRLGLGRIANNIRVPRWVHSTKFSKIEIHGFADASSVAYAVAIYLKSEENNQSHVNLLYAKTKVAPLKKISIPRLELMAAVMLAKMVAHIKRILNFPDAKYFLWSDSQIVLAWIHESPQKRTVFVANRITEIQNLSQFSQWRYIDTKNNPSDLGTRGVLSEDLLHNNLWWKGPDCLLNYNENLIVEKLETVELPLEDNVKNRTHGKVVNNVIQTLLATRKPNFREIVSNVMTFSLDGLNKFSTLSKLVRVVAYCRRVLKNNRPKHMYISPSEFESALIVILKMIQEEVYIDEIECIQTGELFKKSSIYSLNPFINSDDRLLRVSGRLQHATHLNYDQRHPIILPYNHIISRLIVHHSHLATLHGTEQQTMMLITQRYHIIRCKKLVKVIINKCVRCFRFRCASKNQLMGQLPLHRITPNRPFLNSGVDFAGPFDIKRFRGRCQSTYKSYFAVFVCFATKAVHLEVVIDLSTSAFVASFRRFIARRGMVQNLYSDCGRNFVGAKSIVTRNMAEIENQWNEEMSKELSQFNTTWNYNPPGSPHFGGLMEAGVKSVKKHLKRIVGNTRLTYDEFETVLLQIESCLNSRPLCEIRSNTDTLVITPGHFLIQDHLLSLPDDNRTSHNKSYGDRWNMIQKVLQDFWSIWSQEYLNTLRQRKKWRKEEDNLKVGDVVVLMDKNLPPNSWLLAKVIEVHPGYDKLVRVVTLKTKNTILKRPITKICPLPIQEE